MKQIYTETKEKHVITTIRFHMERVHVTGREVEKGKVVLKRKVLKSSLKAGERRAAGKESHALPTRGGAVSLHDGGSPSPS